MGKIATVLKSGRITIPGEIRKQAGLRGGMAVKIEIREDNRHHNKANQICE